jgi:hypothetical protein
MTIIRPVKFFKKYHHHRKTIPSSPIAFFMTIPEKCVLLPMIARAFLSLKIFFYFFKKTRLIVSLHDLRQQHAVLTSLRQVVTPCLLAYCNVAVDQPAKLL